MSEHCMVFHCQVDCGHETDEKMDGSNAASQISRYFKIFLRISHTLFVYHCCFSKKKVKERIVLREIHLRTTGRHLSMGSHSVICHPTEVTPTGQVGTRFIDPVRMKG